MKIFNRWGQEIFSTENPNEGWDGDHLNRRAPMGVYTYVINYDSYAVFEKEKLIRGQVNLIR
jgi:gliding motility-associated-like protein